MSPADKAAIEAFDKQVKVYIALRATRCARTRTKLSKDSTPERVTDAYKTALELSLRNARPNAKRGEFFLPATADFIRRTLKLEFAGQGSTGEAAGEGLSSDRNQGRGSASE